MSTRYELVELVLEFIDWPLYIKSSSAFPQEMTTPACKSANKSLLKIFIIQSTKSKRIKQNRQNKPGLPG